MKPSARRNHLWVVEFYSGGVWLVEFYGAQYTYRYRFEAVSAAKRWHAVKTRVVKYEAMR